jgi:hypothetical protein
VPLSQQDDVLENRVSTVIAKLKAIGEERGEVDNGWDAFDRDSFDPDCSQRSNFSLSKYSVCDLMTCDEVVDFIVDSLGVDFIKQKMGASDREGVVKFVSNDLPLMLYLLNTAYNKRFVTMKKQTKSDPLKPSAIVYQEGCTAEEFAQAVVSCLDAYDLISSYFHFNAADIKTMICQRRW